MKRPSAVSLLWHQARAEWRVFWRTPISAFFTIFFPLLIFVVFSLVFGNERIDYLGITTAQFYAPSLAVFAAVSATYTNLSIFTSYQRDEGILKRVRGTPLPSWIFFGGKILSSILIALMAMLGGAGSLWGPIIGAGILIPLKSYLKEWLGGMSGLAGMDLILYAVIIMVISAKEPRGVWGIVERIRRRKRT